MFYWNGMIESLFWRENISLDKTKRLFYVELWLGYYSYHKKSQNWSRVISFLLFEASEAEKLWGSETLIAHK